MRLIVFAVVTIVSWSQVGAGAPYFRKGYEYNAHLQNFYKYQKTAKNWTEAYQLCHLEGATLAVPEDDLEAEYIRSLINTNWPGTKFIYLGWQDILSEGIFTTAEGASIDDVYYQKWQVGEPNNGNGDRHCVVMDKQGLMQVYSCETVLPYVCKKTLASLEWNEACQLPDPDYQLDPTSKKCYKFNLTPRTWPEAFKVCAAEESYLAVINSQAEADLLVNITANAPKDSIQGNYLRGAVLLGFHNLFESGYITIFGDSLEKSGYSLWGGGQPDSAEGPELCGSMFNTGQLNDISCDKYTLFFICEHDVGTRRPTFDPKIINYI